MSWINRLRNTLRDRKISAEIDDELEFHVDTRLDHNRRLGLSERDARDEARRHLGNPTRQREEMRDARVLGWLDETLKDLTFGARIFKRHFALSALAVLTLSMGIGANAAIYSVVRAVWLRPLPFPAADRLVVVLDGRRGGRASAPPTVPEALELRRAARTLDAVSFYDTRDFQVTGGVEPERVIGARVDPALLPMLGVQPAIGRVFANEDAEESAVLSDGLWRRNFGADPAVVGRRIELSGIPFRIVGVLGADRSLNELLSAPVDLYVPYPRSPDYTSRSGEYAGVRRVTTVARIAPNASREAALAEVSAIAAGFVKQYPATYRPPAAAPSQTFVMSLEPLQESLTRGGRSMVALLAVVVALLLLTACLNTAQFLLVQSLEREGEVALRAVLGAGRVRLVRQFVVETLLITATGGALGVLQAVWLTPLLKAIVDTRARTIIGVELDSHVVLFMLGLTVVTSVVCSLVPVLRLSGADLSHTIERHGATGRRARSRQWFIAGEVAISVVLLAGAALLLRSLRELGRAQGGFSAQGVYVLRMRGLAGGPASGELYAQYTEQIKTLPAIDAVAVTSSTLPGRPGMRFTMPGASPIPAGVPQETSYQIVSGTYFTALGIPLEAGRVFTDEDRSGRPPVAVINREMADRFWPGRSPLGQTIRAGDGPRDATMTIVGIVGNVRPPLQNGDVPQMYVSYRQQSEANIAFLIRMRGGAPLPVAEIKHAIRSVDRRQAVFGITTLEEQLAGATASQRTMARLLGSFAALAVVMSLAGLYIVVSYVASRRSTEVAIRRAIGATDRDVLLSLAGPTLRWSLVGLTMGVAGAFGGSRGLQSALAGIGGLDPTFMTVISAIYVAVVIGVLLAATLRAVRAEPMATLRLG